MNAAALDSGPAILGRKVESFSIDSREVSAGSLFFALSQPDYRNNGFNGEFEDSTRYIPDAFEKGAAACVARDDRFREHYESLKVFSDRIIIVDDTIAALQRLANRVYQDWGGPVVAVTGSAGKTTAKELIALVLAAGGRRVLKNIKNYNNGLGHPLTVLNLANDKGYDVAVLEMGMSTPMNEIARLCRITPPEVGVELNVLPVHLEHLGSIEKIGCAKAELVEGLKPGGTAVLNADDPRVEAMANLHRGRVIKYGIDAAAEISARDIETAGFGRTAFTLETPSGKSHVLFPLNGRHNILNALAASAVGYLFGMGAGQIAEALSKAVPPEQRGEVLRFKGGFTVINDSYNSNPEALLSMVRVLAEGSAGARRKIVAAGEMLELGERAGEIHRETGRRIAECGVDMLIGIRGLAEDLIEGAREGGLKSTRFASDSISAGDFLAGEIREGDCVLVKGSRGVRTEKVIEKLLERFELEGEAGKARAE